MISPLTVRPGVYALANVFDFLHETRPMRVGQILLDAGGRVLALSQGGTALDRRYRRHRKWGADIVIKNDPPS